MAPFRGTAFRASYLRRAGWPLALARVTVRAEFAQRLVDCTDPRVLLERGLRPDELAHHDRKRTQAVARRLHADPGVAGLRWWSALTGAWHSVVVFTDRERPGDVTFDAPELLHPADRRLTDALDMLGVRR